MNGGSAQAFIADGYLLNDSDILKRHGRVFWRAFWISFFLIFSIWSWRIGQFEHTRLANESQYSWSEYQHTASIIVFDHLGILSISTTALSFIIMWLVWQDFGIYLCATKPGADPSLYGTADKRRARAALHEPPGDVFTLVGIAFTFVGLALSLVTLSTDIIYEVVNGTNHVQSAVPVLPTAKAEDVVSAAIIFGSSLAVGLIASLQGVMLALGARQLAAELSIAVRSAAELSDDFEHLKELGRNGVISAGIMQIKERMDLLGAQPAPASVDAKLAMIVKRCTTDIEREIQAFVDGENFDVDGDAANSGAVAVALRKTLFEVRKRALRQIRIDLPKLFGEVTSELKARAGDTPT